MIRKRLLSACLALALCLSLLPVTALAAAEGAPSQLYVGDQQVSSGNDITYWTTDKSTGGLRKYEGNDDNWNVKYDPTTVTLTLSGATIQGGTNTGSAPFGSGIYALSSSNQSVALTIKLIGTNTITGNYGIYVDAQQGGTVGTNASLLIQNSGDDGSLEVSGSSYGIYVKSGTGDASLTIKNASVDAKTTQTYSSYAGVCVQSGSDATSSPNISLSVDGGSLTASASEGNDGIQFYVGSSKATGATTSLTVSENAIVRAENGINAYRVDKPTPSGTGIVFNDKKGTVYDDVTLDESLTIAQGETLTIPEGSTLTVPEGKILTNNGTIDNSGTLTNNGTVTNNGTLNVNEGGKLEGETTGGSGTVVNTPTITAQPESQSVTEGNTATFTVAATGENLSYQWQQSTDNGQSWTNISGAISSTYTTDAATLAMNNYQYQCVVSNSAGSVTSSAAPLTVNAATVSVTGVSLNKTALSLYTDETATLTATVEPDNATNKNVTWSTSNASIATVDANGEVTAVSAGTATITATAEDGGKTDTCTVTVREEAPDRPIVNIPDTHEIELIVGEGGEAKLSLTNASEGSTITVTATPDEGYELDYITVDGERIDGTTFTMPDHDVTVRVYFTDGAALHFTDVSAGAWYFDAVGYVYVGGLMDGVSDTLFDPDGTMTRAMVWAILARVDGETVTGDGWIETAREWAVAEGVSDGENATDYVTREQFATMLWRYASGKGYDVSIGEDTNILSYADFADLSEYAIPAMQWACGAGVITGVTDATLVPQGEATRAQCAAMLMRFVEAIG